MRPVDNARTRVALPDPEVAVVATSTYDRDTIVRRLQAIREDASTAADAERRFLRRAMDRKGWN